MKETFDELIEQHLKSGCVHHSYTIDSVLEILAQVEKAIEDESTLLKIDVPLKICGDIHGHYCDLLRIFERCGSPIENRYLFLGDYVDRGSYSMEVIVLLFLCKIQYPMQIFLLRGNHEIPSINRTYGFYTEIRRRYNNPDEWPLLHRRFNEIFSKMPLAAVVAGHILCVHGGISPSLRNLQQIADIRRPITEPSGLVRDLLWSDPDASVSGFVKNRTRQISYFFGEEQLINKLNELNIDCLIRGHQVVNGFAFFADRRMITIFSATSCHRMYNNSAAIIQVSSALEISFVTFDVWDISKYETEMVGTL
uniref:Serine/threonine-protein phosphatase n=1 Tax=Ascaris suum TaxID=6253 RepID=F1L2P1_ASCSU